MDLAASQRLLLLAAFRHRIREPDLEAGFRRLQALTGGELGEDGFRAALAACMAAGQIHDPVRLPPGALQCHWHLELTPAGVEAARHALQEAGN